MKKILILLFAIIVFAGCSKHSNIKYTMIYNVYYGHTILKKTITSDYYINYGCKKGDSYIVTDRFIENTTAPIRIIKYYSVENGVYTNIDPLN